MIWAFLAGAYCAGFGITLFVSTKAHLHDGAAVTTMDAAEFLALALLWPLAIAFLMTVDD